jgi:hypothetical protein
MLLVCISDFDISADDASEFTTTNVFWGASTPSSLKPSLNRPFPFTSFFIVYADRFAAVVPALYISSVVIGKYQ